MLNRFVDEFVASINKMNDMNEEYLQGLQQAYEVYATTVNKRVDQLTDLEKRQAWLNELIRRHKTNE